MLEVRDIQTFYGSSQALFGVSLDVHSGEVVTLLGRNGMGKSTCVRSIMGLAHPRTGSIRFRGVEIRGVASHTIARAGLGLVPEGRQVFPNLTVRENLIATAANYGSVRNPWNAQRIYGLFPRLAERTNQMAGQLSGGEQQMLSIGRALMTNPRLMILDEATEGLAPLVRDEIWAIIELLRAQQQSILLIDKNLDALLRVADRHYIMEKGRVVWIGSSTTLRAEPEQQARYLGI